MTRRVTERIRSTTCTARVAGREPVPFRMSKVRVVVRLLSRCRRRYRFRGQESAIRRVIRRRREIRCEENTRSDMPHALCAANFRSETVHLDI